MMLKKLIGVVSFCLNVSAELITDSGAAGPPIELVHTFYDEWPTGIAVSSSGRMFANYPPGLDPGNTNNGKNGKYTVAELTSKNKEVAYPSSKLNNPPGGAINYTTFPPRGANYQDYLIGVQSVVIDSADRLWILDTGRALTPEGYLPYASFGGPKLVGVDLSNDSVFKTIVFPPTVAYPDSYLNDVRFDLRPHLTSSGKGVAYITDSSNEGRNGLVIVDLGTGKSWRHLDGNSAVRAESQFVAYVWGHTLYTRPAPGDPYTFLPFGSDGIAISADGEDLYWGEVAGRYLYSIPTKRLRAQGETSEIMAQSAVVNHGQKGLSDGFETDSNGMIYVGNIEQNAVSMFDPSTGMASVFVRDPRINWVDTMSVATDGYLYFTVNQLFLMSSFYPGTDRRVKPYALFKVKLPNHGTKISLK